MGNHEIRLPEPLTVVNKHYSQKLTTFPSFACLPVTLLVRRENLPGKPQMSGNKIQ
jgi:hypothetical protein